MPSTVAATVFHPTPNEIALQVAPALFVPSAIMSDAWTSCMMTPSMAPPEQSELEIAPVLQVALEVTNAAPAVFSEELVTVDAFASDGPDRPPRTHLV